MRGNFSFMLYCNNILMLLLYGVIWKFLVVTTYRIAQKFDGGNFDVFDVFQLDRQNLNC